MMSSNKENKLSKKPNRNLKEIDFKEWLVEFTSLYREELNNLPLEKAKYHTLEDLSEPAQFLVIWAMNPEFQIVFISHSLELDDKLIEIYGPLENRSLLDIIEEKMNSSKLIKVIGKDNFENSLIYALRIIQNYYDPLTGPLENGIYSKFLVNNNPYSVCWVVVGSLQNLDKKEIIRSFLASIKSSTQVTSIALPQEENVIIQGVGSYIHPPVWIGEPPEPKSLKEKMFDIPLLSRSKNIVLKETYKGIPVVFTKNGYIAVGVTDKLLAQEYINEILAILLLRGILVNAVREADLSEIKITERGGESISWNPLNLRSLAYELSIYNPSLLPRTIVSEENIRKSIKLAELLTSDERIKTLLLLYLEAYTYLQNSEYKQSLIIGWIIIEDFYIKDLWMQYILKISDDKRRISKLGSWSVDERLEALNIAGILRNEDFSLLMKIKDIRNEVVHEGKFPEKDIVESCINFAAQVVRWYIGNYIGGKIHEL